MSRTKKTNGADVVDGKSAGAGEQGEAQIEPVFNDGPLDAEQAIAELIELNHERMECQRRYETAKEEATDAKKELDAASNAISLLIDRIDRQQNGQADQPVLKTLPGSAEATV
jgi:hypothetical protein